jgi:hypothetical protein
MAHWSRLSTYLREEEKAWPEDKTIKSASIECEPPNHENILDDQWSSKASTEKKNTEILNLAKYSSYFRAASVVAFILRFVYTAEWRRMQDQLVL